MEIGIFILKLIGILLILGNFPGEVLQFIFAHILYYGVHNKVHIYKLNI